MAVIQSLERAIDILELLSVNPNGIQVKDISSKLDLNKSTVSRMLSTLVIRGYALKKNDGSYKLGLKIVDISSMYLNNLQLKTESLPFLDFLRNKTNLIIHLGAYNDEELIYLEKITSFTNLRMYSQIGKKAMLHSTGLGKAVLSTMTDREVENILSTKKLEKLTSNTMTDIKDILRDVRVIRERGYAIDDEENECGMKCVASPIFDYRGTVIGAISATGIVDVMTVDKIKATIPIVMETADKISEAMGYRNKDRF